MSQTVFVTGASGFVGSHVVDELLEKGYHVKAAARGKKAETLRVLFAENHSIEIVEISDIVYGQFQEALVGVDAVIHVASPLPGRASPQEMLNSAIEGSLNVLRQAEKAGVKKFVVTSSIVALMPVDDPAKIKGIYTTEHWNPVTKENVLHSDDKWVAYQASKKYAELAVWEWAEAHPHVDVTTILPPFIYGPFAHKFVPIPKPEYEPLASILMIYNLLFPTGNYLPIPDYADFRDVARAHVGALNGKPDKNNRKRILFLSPHVGEVTNEHVLDIIKKKHPELERRFISSPVPEFPDYKLVTDYERIKEVTGVSKEDFRTLEETILDTVNDLLKIEEEWKKNGYNVTEVPSFV